MTDPAGRRSPATPSAAGPDSTRRVGLRQRLLLVVAAGILPLAAVSGLGLLALVADQKERAKQAGLEVARALSTAVDAELQRSISVLEALATDRWLDSGDLAPYHEVLRRNVTALPQWLSIVLHDPAGGMRLNTLVPFGREMPATAERESLDRVLQTRRPVVGSLARGPFDTYIVAVRVPVIRDGALRYVLSAFVTPDAIREIVDRQRLPPDWVVSVFDEKGLRVARSRRHLDFLGKEAAPSLKRLLQTGAAEDTGFTYALEGDPVYTAYSRSLTTGWTVAIGTPPSAAESGVTRALLTYGGGILLSIAVGLLAALRVGRRITAPMAELRAAARALGRREPVSAPATTIREIRDVADALHTAAEERARHEAERERLLAAERRARAESDAANRAKDEFLALMSHELRTPLNAILGWARLLQIGTLDEPARTRALTAIVNNAAAQTRLVDDLLDLSRVARGQVRLDPEPVALPRVVEAALETARPAADVKGVALVATLDDPGPIMGAPDRLQQVVWNLLMNAVKFTPSGGRVEVTVQRAEDAAELIVADTGQGIAPDVLLHVFDRFWQEDRSTTRAHGGLGLGLTLVKHLVQLHGGEVHAESAGRDKGATFTVRLPLRR